MLISPSYVATLRPSGLQAQDLRRIPQDELSNELEAESYETTGSDSESLPIGDLNEQIWKAVDAGADSIRNSQLGNPSAWWNQKTTKYD